MKKVIFTTVLIIIATVTLSAQQFGVKAGLNLAKMYYTGENSSEANKLIDTKIGFQIGAVAEFEMSDSFSFQPEVIFSTQGYQIETKNDTYSSKGKMKLNYINIPLMAKYYVAEGFSIQAGPQVGFLISANTESETTTGGNTTNFDQDIKDDTKNIDFGINFGLGYKMESGLFFDARYNLGLSDVADERNDGDDGKFKNAVINVTLGYLFDF